MVKGVKIKQFVISHPFFLRFTGTDEGVRRKASLFPAVDYEQNKKNEHNET